MCTDFDATRAKFNAAQDHVHLLAQYPPKVALSHLANSVKGVSSRRLRQDFVAKINKAAKHNRFWSPSYFARSCDGPPLSTVQDYITNQKQPDQARFPPCPQGQSFHPRSPMPAGYLLYDRALRCRLKRCSRTALMPGAFWLRRLSVCWRTLPARQG